MTNWFIRNKSSLIRNSFLLPILLVVIMSISHVVTWYSLGNPYAWAIYLSIAIEIFALASVSASTLNIGKKAIWFLFIVVTLIQVIGNVFFEYQFIDAAKPMFVSWMELIQPLTEDWTLIDHKRLLAMIQGGTLPIMSLTALHFYIEYDESHPTEPEDEVIAPEVENIGEEASLEDFVEEPIPEVTIEDAPVEIIEEAVDDRLERLKEYDDKLDRLVTKDADTNITKDTGVKVPLNPKDARRLEASRQEARRQDARRIEKENNEQ
jgi:hypothetical protein